VGICDSDATVMGPGFPALQTPTQKAIREQPGFVLFCDTLLITGTKAFIGGLRCTSALPLTKSELLK